MDESRDSQTNRDTKEINPTYLTPIYVIAWLAVFSTM